MGKKTLLAIGDLKDFDTFRKFYKQRRFFRGSDIIFKSADYDSILEGKFPKVSTKEVIVFLFFPFEYWDKHIEPKHYRGVYGNRGFYSKFIKFWELMKEKVDESYADKKISYVNPPGNLAVDRDKEVTKSIVSKAGVMVPKKFGTRSVRAVVKLLNEGYKLFIKVRFGSMGKGVTYLEKGRWMTNFRFRDGKIVSKKSDYGWTFIDITGKKDFLSEILKKDVIVEEAINPLLVKGRKFDLRLYVFKGEVLYVYARSTDAEAVTTNISQGAIGEGPSFVNSLPEKQLEFAKRNAVRAIKALGLNFGGVDIMLCSDHKSAMFIEINAFPGFPKVRRFNLSKFLIEEIVKEYRE
jgi:hypothetical protein